MRRGQLRDPAGGRMEAKLQFLERERPIDRNDDLAVEDEAPRREPARLHWCIRQRQWQAQGFDLHSLVADPQFVDAANGNFTLAANSPASALGFQDIPTAQIGLVGYHAINSYDMFGHIAA